MDNVEVRRRLVLIAFAVIVLLSLAVPSSAQSPVIQITTPIAGQVIEPGTTLNILVSVIGNAQLTGLQILAGDLGISTVATASPYSFQLQIPQISPGIRSLVAVGQLPSGALVQSSPVQIDVEPSSTTGGTITGLRPMLRQIGFGYIGAKTVLPPIYAKMSDGSSLNVAHSGELHVASENQRILKLDNTQNLIAVGPGATALSIKDGDASTSIAVSVPNSIRGDLIGHGIVDLDDLAVIQAALNTTATRDPETGKDIDARDLNGDGVINIEDARILTTLCTYPRCASHP